MSESDQESHQYRKLLNLLDGNDFDRAVLYSSFIGFFSVSYQLILSSLTQPLIDMVYYYPGNLSSTSVLFLRVSILFGMLIGQLFFGFFADLFGRKPLFTSQLFLLTLATCGIAMASRGEVYSTSLFGWLVSWRLILGIGIGAEYPISALLTCEFIAPRRRTRMLSTVFAAQPFGFLGAVAVTSIVVIAYGGSIPRLVGENTCNSHECRLPLDRAWRVVIATGLIPVYVAHFLRQILPESPMYTASVLKRPDKAISNYRKGFIFWGKRRLKSHDANDAQFVAHAESLRDRLDHFDSEMIELDTIELRNSVSVRDLTPSQVLPRRETLARCRSSTLSSSKEPFSDVALRVYWSGLYEYLFRDGQWPKLLGVSLASLFFGATYYPLVQLAAVTISSKLFRQAPPGTGCTFQNGITLDTWPAQFDVAPNCTSLATRRSLRTGVTSYLWQFVLVLCLGLILGAFFIPLLGQRLSPRRTQILGFWSTTLSLFLAGAVFRFADGSTTVSLNVFLFALVTATIGFTGGPIFTLPAELFTIQYRGFCYGFAAASGQIGAIALQAVLHVVDFRNSTGSHTSSETGTIWLGTALLYLSLVAFAGVIFTSVFIPETDFHSRTLAFKWPKIPRPGRALVRLRNWRRHDL
ncbi:MFS general substrate transporter [Tothia fuscella]|uniref:MFS general substrate transporter n=1 Tax=Tothia fuscella TaxID=1048955 RepID=A0A9P4TTL5_9PEZI|nr:MFS general substrate transporter [Tothia fuscella]